MYEEAHGGQRSTSVVILQESYNFVFETGSLTGSWSLSICKASLAIQAQGTTPCLCLPSAGITNISNHFHLFMWTLGTKLRLSCEVSTLLSKLSLQTHGIYIF